MLDQRSIHVIVLSIDGQVTPWPLAQLCEGLATVVQGAALAGAACTPHKIAPKSETRNAEKGFVFVLYHRRLAIVRPQVENQYMRDGTATDGTHGRKCRTLWQSLMSNVTLTQACDRHRLQHCRRRARTNYV